MNRHAAHAYKAVAMIDLLTGYFDGGNNWICGEWQIGNRRCLVSALRILRVVHGIKGDPTRYYIREAIRKRHKWRCDLVSFNDVVAKTYDKVAPVLAEARELALAAAENYQRTIRLAA
jgi:hypothetical protein